MTLPQIPSWHRAGDDPLIDFDRLLAAIRLRRRLCAVAMFVGLVLGLVGAVLLPPTPTASASVLVARMDDLQGDRAALMATDVALCGSTEVADVAAAALGLDAAKLLEKYTCAAVTGNVLSVAAKAKTAKGAERTAQGIADAYVARHIGQVQAAVDAEADELLVRRAKLERSTAQIVSAIDAASSAQQVSALTSVRSKLVLQMDDLTRRASDLRLRAAVVAAGTTVFDPARAAKAPGAKRFVICMIIGLVLGVGGGLGISLLAGVVRDRPVRRRDIARALGTTVLLHVRPRRRWGPKRRGEQDQREQRAAAATLGRLVAVVPGAVSVLEIGCPREVIALVADVAEQLEPGRPVVLASGLRRSVSAADLTRLQAATTVLDQSELGSTAEDGRWLGVGSVGPRTGWIELRRLGAQTVLLVRAGHATEAALHTVARHLARAEIDLLGVVLVGPDPRDSSDGDDSDEFYAAMRRHLGWPAPPEAIGTAVPGELVGALSAVQT